MKFNITILTVWLLLVSAIPVTPANIHRYPDNCLVTLPYVADLTKIPKACKGKVNKQIPVKTSLKYKTKGHTND